MAKLILNRVAKDFGTGRAAVSDFSHLSDAEIE